MVNMLQRVLVSLQEFSRISDLQLTGSVEPVSFCVIALNLLISVTVAHKQTTKFCLLLSFTLKFETNFILYHKGH